MRSMEKLITPSPCSVVTARYTSSRLTTRSAIDHTQQRGA